MDVGLVGCGRWGRHVLRDLRDLGCAVHVVARSDESVARAREGGAASVVPDARALPEVAGVVVATTSTAHTAAVESVLDRDVPVFVEKPLAVDVAEAERLAASGRVFVMDKWRYHPGVRELARIARSGELGAVRALVSRRVTDEHRHSDVDTVWVHAPHDLAICLEVLGHLPPVAWAVPELVAGELVGVVAALGGPPWCTFEISCVAPAHRREARLVCEEGVALLDGGWAEEVVVRRGAEVERRPTPGELPLLAELRAFVGHLGGGPPPLSPGSDGALVVRRIAEVRARALEAAGA